MPGNKKNLEKISFRLVDPLFPTLRRKAKIEDFRHPARDVITLFFFENVVPGIVQNLGKRK